jgi:hypothetical protein
VRERPEPFAERCKPTRLAFSSNEKGSLCSMGPSSTERRRLDRSEPCRHDMTSTSHGFRLARDQRITIPDP